MLGDAAVFDAEGLLSALRAGLEGIQGLGAAVEGDKTIVDAYAPALAAVERALRAGGTLAGAAQRASEAAGAGARATVPLQARKGCVVPGAAKRRAPGPRCHIDGAALRGVGAQCPRICPVILEGLGL